MAEPTQPDDIATDALLGACQQSVLNAIVRVSGSVRAHEPGDNGNQPTVRERPALPRLEHAKPVPPPLYAVILMNDDYTPRAFVTQILKRHFGLDGDTAETIMMHAHRHGEARVGAWQKDIAETKMHGAEEDAREEGHPLKFRCVPVEP